MSGGFKGNLDDRQCKTGMRFGRPGVGSSAVFLRCLRPILTFLPDSGIASSKPSLFHAGLSGQVSAPPDKRLLAFCRAAGEYGL